MVSQANVKRTQQCYGGLDLLKKTSFLFPLNYLCQLVDHYCHWFLELPFSRISKSTTGYTFTPMWDLLIPLAQTPDRRDHSLLVSLPKDTGKCEVMNCPSFETAVGGIEPPSPRLRVRRSTARPPLLTTRHAMSIQLNNTPNLVKICSVVLEIQHICVSEQLGPFRSSYLSPKCERHSPSENATREQQ